MKTSEIYLIYECDKWHSRNSFNLIAATNRLSKCINVIQDYIKKNEYEKLTDFDIENLNTFNQTQGNDNNYVIESIELC